MRKLRPGVARAWRRIVFWQKVNAAFAKTLPKLVENFYAETPVQREMKKERMQIFLDPHDLTRTYPPHPDILELER